MAWLTVMLALKYGLPGWRAVDAFGMVGAVIGTALWAIFDSPVLGLSASLCVVFIGSIPTFVSGWEDSTREHLPAWITYWISCVFALIAVPHWTIQDAAQPVAFFAVETVMVSILIIRRFVVKAIKA